MAGLQGFSATGGVDEKLLQNLDPPPDFKKLVADEARLADHLAPGPALKRWKSASAGQQGAAAGSQKSGTAQNVNTDQYQINALQVTVISGTLWIFLQEADPSGSEIPDYAFGAMAPVNTITQPVPLDKYFITLFASGADCTYAVLGVAL